MTQEFIVDLQKIDGDGAFPCPKCAAIISPDDESENNYRILETDVKDEQLKGLLLQCTKCKTLIRLIGFEDEV